MKTFLLGFCMAVTGVAFAQAAQPSTANFVKYGERLQINGDLTPDFAAAMEKLLDGNPLVSAVELNSKGAGDVAAATMLRDFIRKKDLNVFVDEECSNLCLVVFLGGKRRVMTENARLGFAPPGKADALREASGLSADFVAKAAAAPDTYYPSPDDLLGAGAVTDVIPPYDEPRF